MWIFKRKVFENVQQFKSIVKKLTSDDIMKIEQKNNLTIAEIEQKLKMLTKKAPNLLGLISKFIFMNHLINLRLQESTLQLTPAVRPDFSCQSLTSIL